MKKSILLVRTSTDRQEIDTQISDLTAYARQYSSTELVVVGSAGASAIKEDAQYTRNINEVIKLIENETIECVYVWEISRIGRREETLFRFKNFLIEHAVNLRIKNPTLELLNADGTVNGGCELAFSLFSTMAQQEMLNKRERFKRGKARNTREGKYNGGGVLYGYTVVSEGVEKGKFAVKEEEAKNVREIFSEYVTSTKGTIFLKKKYGIEVEKMLKNRHYYGEGNYPPIVSKETFELAEKKRALFRNQPRERTTRYNWCDYCHGLVFCTHPDFPIKLYAMCIQRSKNRYGNRQFNVGFNITMLDSLATHVLQVMIETTDFSSIKREYEKKQRSISVKVCKLKDEIIALERKLEKLEEDYYVRGRVKHFDKYKDMIDSEINTKQNEINNLLTEKNKLTSNTFHKPNLYKMNDLERKEIIQKYIKEIKYITNREREIKHLVFTFNGLGITGADVEYIPKKYTYFFEDEPFEWREIPKIKKDYCQK